MLGHAAAPGARAYSGELAVSPDRQTADDHYPVDTIRREISVSCRSTVNRDPFADSLLTVACDSVVADVGARLRRTGASDRERTPRR